MNMNPFCKWKHSSYQMELRVFLSTWFHVLVTETRGTKLLHPESPPQCCQYLPFVVPQSNRNSKSETCHGFKRTWCPIYANIVSKES